MESLTRLFVRLLSPILKPASRWLSSPKRKWETWVYEAIVVAFLLSSIAASTTPWSTLGMPGTWRPFFINWLAAAAVLGSFLQAQVGFRLAEKQAASNTPSVWCHAWSSRYWLWKELLWFLVFLLSGAYAAIAGNVIFILYPAWRSIHTQERIVYRSIHTTD